MAMSMYCAANNVRVALASSANAVTTSLRIGMPSPPWELPVDPLSRGYPNDTLGGLITIFDSMSSPSAFECVTYTSITDNLDGTYTLGGCFRGVLGTTAQAWASGAFVTQSPNALLDENPYIKFDWDVDETHFTNGSSVHFDGGVFFNNNAAFLGNVYLSGATLNWGFNQVPITAINQISGFSVLANNSGSAGNVTVVTASTANRFLGFNGSTFGFIQVGMAALATTGTANNAAFLRGDGAWSNNINGPFTVTGNFTVSGGSVTLPNNTVARTALANAATLSVIGRGTNTAGAVTDITAVGARQFLATDAAGTGMGFRTFAMADMPTASATSLFGRSLATTGDRFDVISTAGFAAIGAMPFTEGTTGITFDDDIRRRRNVFSGFYDFEGPITSIGGTSFSVMGTPFIGTQTGLGAGIGKANRNTPYTRHCLVPQVVQNGDRCALLMGDATANGNGMPVAAGVIILETCISINALSTVNDYWICNLGGINNDSVTPDGVFFQYDRAASANWRLVARNLTGGGSTTFVATSVAVSTTAFRLRIEITATNQANFYINGVFAGSVTSNIPIQVGAGYLFSKTTSTGINNFNDIDYIGFLQALTRSQTNR